MLQNSIETYLKTDSQKSRLIARIIKNLGEVSEYKVQTKWGQEILVSFLDKLMASSVKSEYFQEYQ